MGIMARLKRLVLPGYDRTPKDDEDRVDTLVEEAMDAIRAVQEERAMHGLTQRTGNPVGDFVRRGVEYGGRHTRVDERRL